MARRNDGYFHLSDVDPIRLQLLICSLVHLKCDRKNVQSHVRRLLLIHVYIRHGLCDKKSMRHPYVCNWCVPCIILRSVCLISLGRTFAETDIGRQHILGRYPNLAALRRESARGSSSTGLALRRPATTLQDHCLHCLSEKM